MEAFKAARGAVSSVFQKKETNEESKPKHQDYVITRDISGAMRIDVDSLRALLLNPRIGDKPIAIISVVGQMRTGKSFLLNFFLRYLRKRGWENSDWIGDGKEGIAEDGLVWRGGSSRCTTGIRVFGQLFEIPSPGGEMIVILMDTQGLFDHKTPEVINKTLLTLSTLASSAQIFNSMRQIDSKDLEYLKTCVDFAKATSQGGGSGYVKLQRLMFLVRDFPEDYEGGDDDDAKGGEDDQSSSSYGLQHGTKYLSGFLDSEKGGEELVAIRKGIKETFGKVQCFPMPSPGSRASKKRFNGTNEELDEDFLEYIKLFVEEIASPGKLFPKCTSDKLMTGREILNMMCRCDTTFQEGNFGSVGMIEANEKAYYEDKYVKAFKDYEKEMKDYCEKEKDVELKVLTEKHDASKKRAMETYNSAPTMGSGRKWVTEYQKILEDQCNKNFQEHKNLLEAKQEAAAAKQKLETESALTKYKSQMEGLSLDENFERQHERCYAEICHEYKGRASMELLEEKVKDLHEKIEAEYKKRIAEKEEADKNKRNQELFKLVRITLKELISKKWDEEMKVIRDQDCIEEIRDKIAKEVDDRFWKEVLTEEEKKYSEVLKQHFEAEFGLVCTSVRLKEGGYRPMTLTAIDDATSLREQKYFQHLREVLEMFKQDLKSDLVKANPQAQLQKNKEEYVMKHFKKFIALCCEDIIHYHDKLCEEETERYDRAKQDNKMKWKHFSEVLTTEASEMVLKEAQKLRKCMADCHLEEKKLERIYDQKNEQVRDLLKKYPETAQSKRFREEIEKKVEEMARKSFEELKLENKQNEKKFAARNVNPLTSFMRIAEAFCPIL